MNCCGLVSIMGIYQHLISTQMIEVLRKTRVIKHIYGFAFVLSLFIILPAQAENNSAAKELQITGNTASVSLAKEPRPFILVNSINNRTYLFQIPDNFNNRMVIMFHGSTQNAEHLLTRQYTKQFINLLLSSGFGVVLPNAKPSFGVAPFTSRWESENNNNPDIDFINYILDHDKPQYNFSAADGRTIDKVFLVGGSSGALMASRIVLSRTDIAGLVLVNGSNADQVSLDGSELTYNDHFNIPRHHCPVLDVTSTADTIFPINVKLLFAAKLQAALISSELYVVEGGAHNWDSWVVPFYSNMLGWLLR